MVSLRPACRRGQVCSDMCGGRRLSIYLAAALPAAAAAHDVAVRRLALLASPVAEGRHAPGRDRVAAGGGLALAAAVWVVDRIHRRAARLRPDALVAVTARLADRDVLVLGVAERPDR